MNARRTIVRLGIAAALIATAGVTPLVLAGVAPNQLSWSAPTVAFDGGPVSGPYRRDTCLPTSCVKVPVTVTDDVGSSWASRPGGLVVTISWADVTHELDLFVYDGNGQRLDQQNFGGVTSQRAFVANPPAGTYEIWVQSFSGVATSFTGTATIANQAPRPVAVSTSDTMQFSPVALVDPQLTSGEPGLRLSPTGQAFVDAPWHASTTTSFVWRSSPAEGNYTFGLLDSQLAGKVDDPRHRSCSGSSGGADTDVAAGPGGLLLLADAALATVGVSRSTDNGTTWSCSAAGSTVPDDDRPWITVTADADDTGPAVDGYLAYRAFSVSGQVAPDVTSQPTRLQIDRTVDGGRTWSPAGAVGDGSQLLDGLPIYMKEPGQVFTDRSGSVFVPFSAPGGRVYLARSLDGGETFTTRLVAQRLGTPGYAFVSGAADRTGTLYVAWVDQGTFDLVYSWSKDHGQTWSDPAKINPTETTAVFPWLAAGASGDVAIGWYGSNELGSPDLQSADSRWYPYVARSLNASSAQATFERTPVAQAPVHTGPLCVADTFCDPSLRRFGDFLMTAIDNRGAVRVVFNDDAGAVSPYITTVSQTQGLGLTAPLASPAETHGDAPSPPLDVVTLPSVVTGAGGQPTGIRFQVASGELAGALSEFPVTTTEADWLAIWQNDAGQVRFAGLRLDRQGDLAPFAGTTPTSASFGPDSGYAVYSDATPAGEAPVTGASAADGTITLTFPSWLSAGGIRGLQVFTLVGVPQAGEPLPLRLVDSTPPLIPQQPAVRAPCRNPHASKAKPCRS